MTAIARQIEDLARAYAPGMAVFAAVELGVFDALASPATIPALAAAIHATEDGTARLCNALVALGFVRISDGVVSAVPDAHAALTRESPTSLVPLVQHHHRQVMPPLARLAEAIRTGTPQHHAWPFATAPVEPAPYDELARHPAELRALGAAMDHDSTGAGDAIARALDLRDARHLVDVGCGGGVVARELLRALPELRITSFDRGETCIVARERTAAAGFASRHTIEDRDALRGFGVEGADVVVLSAILADFPPHDRAALLTHAAHALRPGGRIVISETLLDDDRRGPPKAALLSLLTLAITRGDQFSSAQLHAELAAAQFTNIVTRRGSPRDLVVGVRST